VSDTKQRIFRVPAVTTVVRRHATAARVRVCRILLLSCSTRRAMRASWIPSASLWRQLCGERQDPPSHVYVRMLQPARAWGEIHHQTCTYACCYLHEHGVCRENQPVVHALLRVHHACVCACSKTPAQSCSLPCGSPVLMQLQSSSPCQASQNVSSIYFVQTAGCVCKHRGCQGDDWPPSVVVA